MESAITLLQAALGILLFLSTSGSVSEEVRLQANLIARQAIVVAQEQIEAETRADDRREEHEDNDDDMNEEENTNDTAGDDEQEEEAQFRIEIGSPFEEQGLGREYKAVTDPSIERWDQATDNANILVVSVEVYKAHGKKRVRDADVRVEASDESQSRFLGGKNYYQYLFKETGEHTLTFSYGGVEETVVVTAK